MHTPVNFALVLLLTLTVGVSACNEGAESMNPQGGRDSDPPRQLSNGEFPISSLPAERLVPCSPSKQGGGYDLLIEDIPCPTARHLLVPLGDPFSRYGSLAQRNRQVISQQVEGWTCWSELATDFGPIHNVCWRGKQTMVFDEG
jgi:hypothetical protein